MCHNLRGWRSEIRVQSWSSFGESCFHGLQIAICFLYGDSALRISPKPNYFPKAPSSNTIILGCRTSRHEFGRGTNIQSIEVVIIKKERKEIIWQH